MKPAWRNAASPGEGSREFFELFLQLSRTLGLVREKSYLMPLNCTFKNGQNSKFYVTCILQF